MNPLSVSYLFHGKCFTVYWIVVYNQNGVSVPELLQKFRSLQILYRNEITANRTIPELKGIFPRQNFKKKLHQVTVEHATLPFQRLFGNNGEHNEQYFS